MALSKPRAPSLFAQQACLVCGRKQSDATAGARPQTGIDAVKVAGQLWRELGSIIRKVITTRVSRAGPDSESISSRI